MYHLQVLVQSDRRQSPVAPRHRDLDHCAKRLRGICGNGRQLLRPLQHTTLATVQRQHGKVVVAALQYSGRLLVG